jgi:hypothetical protein
MATERTGNFEPNTTDDGEVLIDEAYIRAAMRAVLLSVRTWVPARVLSYDAEKQRVKVEVGFLEVMAVRDGVAPTGAVAVTGEGGDMEAVLPAQEIEDIRVSFDGAWGGSAEQDCYLTWPIKEGTTGRLHCSYRSLEEWYAKGKPADPVQALIHNLADSVFVPGLRHDANVITPATDLEAAVLHAAAIKLHREATELLAIGTKVRDYIKAVVEAGVPVATDGGVNLKATMLAYINAHPAAELSCETVKAK